VIKFWKVKVGVGSIRALLNALLVIERVTQKLNVALILHKS